MLYLAYGENTKKSLEKLNEMLLKLREKSGNEFSFFEVTEDGFNESYFKQLAFSNHLFGNKNLVVLKRVIENEKISDYFIKQLPNLAASSNIFIFWEKKIDEEKLIVFKEKADKIWFFENESRQIDSFTDALQKKNNKLIFEFTDAFSKKLKQQSWFTLQKAVLAGIDEEEIFWKLVWQVKNLVILKNLENTSAKTANKNIGIHPYVIEKTLKVLPLFSKKDLENIAKNLIDVYRQNRYEKNELSFGIEKLILNS